MKTRFNTYDIVANVTGLQKLIGMRVNQIYDIDNKTYLIRFQHGDQKHVLILESGNRFHTTAFEWPKNVAPSGFTMKLRKHLKNKRLEKLQQLGIDRIVDFQFGSGEAAYHIILELYDRGNLILTDCEFNILNILRPHVEDEEVRFAVREKYPLDRANIEKPALSQENIKEILLKADNGVSLKRLLNYALDYGPSVIEHVLIKQNLINYTIKNTNVSQDIRNESLMKKQKFKENIESLVFDLDEDLEKLELALTEAHDITLNARFQTSKGYIIQKREEKPVDVIRNDVNHDSPFFYQNIEYHPFLFLQYKNFVYKEFDTFDSAVDEFYSSMESQKIDLKTLQQEKDAFKKLSNVKKDHEKRLNDLSKIQNIDTEKAELITRNQKLVDSAILAVQSAIANQMSWSDIKELLKSGQSNGDEVALRIRHLKLETNHITLYLDDPYTDNNNTEGNIKSMNVDINLALSAYANARNYYDQKRIAAKKQQKTIDATGKALKSAERKTLQALNDVRTISNITKARKTFWFEKFYWFISSENYLIIGGRDQQQNELIVKRYMRPNDIYVHAEIQGASSIVIRNFRDEPVSPKTLLEAGTMAISYSVAWDAKVVTNAYWVKSDQVSKTAPTGEYLGTGSFMIRGKKNFLPSCNLILGLSFLFKLADSSIENHVGERQIKYTNIEDSINNQENNVIANVNIEKCEEKKEIDNLLLNETKLEDRKTTFPDTHVLISHNTGKVIVQTDPSFSQISALSNTTNINSNDIISVSDDTSFIILPSTTTKIKQQKTNRKAIKHNNIKRNNEKQASLNDQKISNSFLKRGQKGKLKKIKEKYKDQDEEERRIRMDILKSAGIKSTVNLPDSDEFLDTTKNEKEIVVAKNITPIVEFDEDQLINNDLDMLDTLTGCPLDEDEILFAIPVVAPYQALQNYKYKVKLQPGTGKRGKASKTALTIFMKDKNCNRREKELLKSVKDETIARNIPGKVKLSAPQMHKYQ